MEKNEVKNIETHLEYMLDDKLCRHAGIAKGITDPSFCVLRVLVGYEEALTERDLTLRALKRMVDAVKELPPLTTIEEMLREDLTHAENIIKWLEKGVS